MKLEFLKLKKDNIFCEDFFEMKKNNVIDFSDTKINVLYAPNGVGKTSFCKILENEGEFLLKYNEVEYSMNNGELFHVIHDQNSRNIIKGTAKDFLLGDNIVKEFELKKWLDNNFDNIYKQLRNYYKSNINLSKVKDEKFSWIDSKINSVIKQIVNIKIKSTDINLDEYCALIRSLDKKIIEDYDEKKFKYICDNFQIINDIKKITNIKIIKDFEKIEQYDDAIKILKKYNNINNCIICENKINSIKLLENKITQRQGIVELFDEETRKIFTNIIEKINLDDTFNIKGNLTLAVSTGNVEIVINLINEIEKYISIYNTIINNSLLKSLSKEFLDKYDEYKKISSKPLRFTDEDLLFVEEFIEKNINRKIKLERTYNKIVIKIDSEDLLGVERENLKLSSGEQNFISLVFELLKAKNVNSEIIVIDDPISSFDSIFKNKLVFAIIKFLSSKKVILLTHNVDLIRLINYQNNNNFNIYLFNNFEGQENGMIQINNSEKKYLISIPDLLEFIRLNKISEYVKNKKLYIYSLIPFMRGYVKFIGKSEIKNQLTKLMHGYNAEKINIGKLYNELFDNLFFEDYIINVNDILDIDVNNISEIICKDKFPLLNKVLCNNLIYLYLRLKTEKVLVNKYNININRHDQLSSIIAQAFKENTSENSRMKIFFYSKKTLLNEFNHFEGNMNIFQPAIDISESILNRERKEIINKLNTL